MRSHFFMLPSDSAKYVAAPFCEIITIAADGHDEIRKTKTQPIAPPEDGRGR